MWISRPRLPTCIWHDWAGKGRSAQWSGFTINSHGTRRLRSGPGIGAQQEHLSGLCDNSWQLRTLHALRKSRTAALGGHIDRCDNQDCHKLHLSYNSCRNRHCPKCQRHKREQWISAREEELLNVPYFHVVFTIPSELNRICLYDPKTIYNLLFAMAWQVIKGFSSNPNFLGTDPGMVAILHTSGQNLSLYPHLHCIVPGGGISRSGKWKPAMNKGKYLFPVRPWQSLQGPVFSAVTKGIQGSNGYFL